MKMIENYIESKQQEFVGHPFFELLQNMETVEEINTFVPELTFWAMTFQDILRINEERVQDPYLKKIARHHRLEDAGHEKWFLHDKKLLASMAENKTAKTNDVSWLYSKDCQLTRDAAYAIMSEIYKAEDERINIALLLALESSGHVFFEKVVNQVKKTGQDSNLKYFSSSHLEVELAHAMFEEEMEKQLFAIKLPVEVRREGLKMVDRCYEAFNRMFDGLVIVCEERLAQLQKGEKQNAPTTVDIVDDSAI